MNYKLYTISRVKFFEILSNFSFVGDRLTSTGCFFIDAKLTQEEAGRINKTFPNSVRPFAG